MKKNIFIILIFIFSLSFIYSDETTDNSQIKRKRIRDIIVKNIKFRGSLSFVLTYYIHFHDGVNPGNHLAEINYNPLDYTDEGDPDKDHHTDDGRIINQQGTEFEIYGKYDFITPFFKAKNPLMQNNNITFSLLYEISPLTTNIGGSITFNPVPFLNFQTGISIGPGWRIEGLGAGIGFNQEDKGVQRYDYRGIIMFAWFSSTFQMDLAYVLPQRFQRWLHFVTYAIPTIKYQALLGVRQNQPYMYEEDRGENLNGWRFQYEWVLGYQIPVIEDYYGEDRTFIKMRNKRFVITTGFYFKIEKLELTHYYDSPMNVEGGWGSNFAQCEFGPIARFELPWNYWLILFVHFANDKAYTDDTVGNAYFMNRDYEDWYVYFKRIGLFFGWNF